MDEPGPHFTFSSNDRVARRQRWRSLLPSQRARLVGAVFLAISVGMIPWTVFLGFSLPPRYDAGHWQVLWIGFDVGLLVVLLTAAWAAWYRRQILASVSMVAGTLLICDAWFDIVTSFGHRDEWLTLLTGLGGEIPLALFFFWLYRRVVMNTLAVLNQQMGHDRPPRHLRDVILVQYRHGARRIETLDHPVRHPGDPDSGASDAPEAFPDKL